MAKNKIYHETLVGKCSNSKCAYNEGGFCKLPEILLDEEGNCIYKRVSQDKVKIKSRWT